MNERIENINYRDLSEDAVERNKVLKNTYWLLALTMLPTVFGAWVGISTGLSYALSGGLGMIVFLAGAFGFVSRDDTTHSAAPSLHFD